MFYKKGDKKDDEFEPTAERYKKTNKTFFNEILKHRKVMLIIAIGDFVCVNKSVITMVNRF